MHPGRDAGQWLSRPPGAASRNDLPRGLRTQSDPRRQMRLPGAASRVGGPEAQCRPPAA